MKMLDDMGLPKASHIETGFNGWRDDGLPVVSYEDWKTTRPAD